MHLSRAGESSFFALWQGKGWCEAQEGSTAGCSEHVRYTPDGASYGRNCCAKYRAC
jgi:hypothetical protein